MRTRNTYSKANNAIRDRGNDDVFDLVVMGVTNPDHMSTILSSTDKSRNPIRKKTEQLVKDAGETKAFQGTKRGKQKKSLTRIRAALLGKKYKTKLGENGNYAPSDQKTTNLRKDGNKKNMEDSIEIERKERAPFRERSPVLIVEEPIRLSSEEDSLFIEDDGFEENMDYSTLESTPLKSTRLSDFQQPRKKRMDLNIANREKAAYQDPKCSTLLFPSEKVESNFWFLGVMSGISVIDPLPVIDDTNMTPVKSSGQDDVILPRKKRKLLNSVNRGKGAFEAPKCSTLLFPCESVQSNFGFSNAFSDINVVNSALGVDVAQTNSMESSHLYDHPLPRNKWNKSSNASKERTMRQAPKCSTPLISAETVDGKFGFSDTLSGIDVVDPLPVVNDDDIVQSMSMKELKKLDGCNKKKLSQTHFGTKYGVDENGNSVQICSQQRDKYVKPSSIILDDLVNGNTDAQQSCLIDNEGLLTKRDNVVLSSLKKTTYYGLSALKKRKKKSLHCVTFEDFHRERHLRPSSPSSGVDGPSNTFQEKADGVFEICCINRLCVANRRSAKDEGQFIITM